MAYTDLTQIQEKINTHKSDLAANLTAKNVTANASEGFGVLIGKVKDIEQGGSGGGSLDWSTVTDMSYVFYSANKQFFAFLYPTINCDMRHVENWESAFNSAIRSATNNNVFQNNKITFDKLANNMFRDSNQLTDIEWADSLTAYDNNASYCFYGCGVIPLATIFEALKRLDKTNAVNISYIFYSASQSSTEGKGSFEAGDLELNVSSMEQAFRGIYIKSIGNITNIYNQAISMHMCFYGCTYMEEIGLITTPALKVNTYNMFVNCSKLKKINGFSLPSQKYQGEILTSSSLRFISNSSLTVLEECLNIPVGYLRYGGTNIGLAGTSSAVKPLKRLTFCQSDEGYYTKNYAKNLPIQYCSFDRDGMLEVFNTIPDASDVTATSTITITGNPCVADGTLTEEDIAIATAKGYVVTTA